MNTVGKFKPYSYHGRPLLPPSVDINSNKGQKLFKESITTGTAAGILRMFNGWKMQEETRFCGLTSVTVALNSFRVDPKKIWKGNSRWYTEDMLADTLVIDRIRQQGVGFKELVRIAQAHLDVQAFQANGSSIGEFRQQLLNVTSTDTFILVAAYSRRTLNQTGGGHYSPIGAYCATSDMVLIMDVARYKYPYHWVPCELLWEAMCQVNRSTKETRGFMILSRNEAPDIDK